MFDINSVVPVKEYDYDPETFEYVSCYDCAIDPLESELKGEVVWLVGANGTLTAPLEPKEGFVVIYVKDTDSWKYVEDHRDQDYWIPSEGDKWDTPPRKMKELGPLPEGAVTEAPARSPEEILAENWEMLRSMRNFKLSETDYLILADYPVDADLLERVKTYRQALRDMTNLEGAPWDGGGEATPWPEKPV